MNKEEYQIVTVEDFRKFQEDSRKDLEAVLQKFQQDLVVGQTRLNLVWNTLNTVLRVFQEKGLIDEDSLRQAGEDLMKEAKENIERTKAAVSLGQHPSNLIKTPLEETKDAIFSKKNGAK